MTRPHLEVREGVVDDAQALIDLMEISDFVHCEKWHLDDVRSAIASLALNADERLMVGEVEGRLVATVRLMRYAVTPFTSESSIHASFLMVHPNYRKHGFAHQMMWTAVQWAEEKDIHNVSAVASANGRDLNRFLARLSLSTSATVRATSVASLKHKLLASRVAREGGTPSRQLRSILAQRRSMRRQSAGETA